MGCFFRATYNSSRSGLDNPYIVSCIGKTVYRTGVEPDITFIECGDAECSGAKIFFVDISDFELTTYAWFDVLRNLYDTVIVEIEAHDSIVGLRIIRLFLDGCCFAICVECYDTVALRVRDPVRKDNRPIRVVTFFQIVAEVVTVEDVVTKGEGDFIITDEFLGNDECLGEAVG